jgi:hypothetical protein
MPDHPSRIDSSPITIATAITARDGHAQLHARGDDVVALANDAAPPDARFDALTEALRAHDVTLQAHLDLEEDLVVPLLLQL